jgi:hypothetical protein
VPTNSFFEAKADQLLDVSQRLSAAMDEAGIDYALIGGLAVYLHVDRLDPLAARLTRDVDVSIRREDLRKLAAAAEHHGFSFRHAGGIDRLVDASVPNARSAVHVVFAGEQDCQDYVAIDGVRVAPVAHLVRMKLTSFRPKDMVHIQDLLAVGLVSNEVEAALPAPLRARLEEVNRMER